MVRSTLTTSLAGSNNDLKYTSKIAGASGDNIKIKYTNPGQTTASTTAAVTGAGTALSPYEINVTLSYADAAITATAANVKAAIEASTAANALVKVENASSNDGTGLVIALSATALASGVTGSDASVLTTALTALVQNNNDWYYLLCDMHDYNEIVALSTWAASKTKLYFAVTKDDNLVDFSIVNQDRCVLIYHDQDTDYPDAALVGYGAATIPGSITWKFKTLQGIDAAAINDSRVLELTEKNINTYVSKFGVLQTSEGLCTSGEYIDVVVGEDWVNTQLVQAISSVLYNQPKVPYDNRGIGLILSTVLNVLREATDNGIIAKDDAGKGLYSATAPKKSDVSSADIAARTLNNVLFSYTIAGAVHDITINGTISY
jgi:hypothetical protein